MFAKCIEDIIEAWDDEMYFIKRSCNVTCVILQSKTPVLNYLSWEFIWLHTQRVKVSKYEC